MHVLLANSARFLRRRRPRDRDRRAGARAATARRSTSGTRSSTTSSSSTISRPRARCSSRSSTRCRRAAPSCSPRTACPRRVRAEAEARGSQRVRRDLSAGDEGPRRGREDARAGPRDRDDRPRGPPRGRGHDGPVRRRHPPRRVGRRTSSGSRSQTPDALAYVTQTTLSVDDAAAIVAALKRRFPAHRRPEEGRHLLRDAEPAGRREVHGADRRRGHRRRQPEQLQLEPAPRGRRESRRAAPT